MVAETKGLLPGGHLLKVILETGALPDADAIAGAARLAIGAGADRLKTSTGKLPISATPEAARVILSEIAAADRPVSFKAAGGIRTLEDAVGYPRSPTRSWGRPGPVRPPSGSARAACTPSLSRQ
jgi:deoxyribose-phosphate aldolase